ncbi:MAG: lysylphosphatidylglycerol synthase transmembrane domain-containing protein, partial [Anaerolineae bacterium]
MIEPSDPFVPLGAETAGSAMADSAAALAGAIPVLPGLAAPPKRRMLRWLARLGLFACLAILLYIALRKAPLNEIRAALLSLRPWQMALLLAVDALIYALVTARWWLVVRAEHPRIRYLPMIAVRLSVFGVSYFTVGPQVGGEPLQVLYLQRRYGISYTRASASVLMDKLFELLGNFVLLSFGLVAIFQSGLLNGASTGSRLALSVLALLITWPLVHIVLLYRRVYPVSTAIRLLGPQFGHRKGPRFVRACERLAGQFCQRHPRAMLSGLVVSLLSAAATVAEYALITSFLHLGLPFWKLVTAWTTGWLSFLVPLPGGLGALEASQVSVLGLFGVSAAVAVSVALVMRGRDLLIGGLGLLLAGGAAR